MTQSWKLTAYAPRPVIEAALIAHEDAFDWDPEIVLSGSEIAEDQPEDWRIEAWLPRKPTRADKAAVAALFAAAPPPFEVEQLPEVDWVTQSQLGVEPIRAGCFHIHTPTATETDKNDPRPGNTEYLAGHDFALRARTPGARRKHRG